MQIFEFSNTLSSNNKFALTTDNLTLCIKGCVGQEKLKHTLLESFPDTSLEIVKSITSKLSFDTINIGMHDSKSELDIQKADLIRFWLYFLISSNDNDFDLFPCKFTFMTTKRKLTDEEKALIDLHCPRFDISLEQIEKWSEIVTRFKNFEKYRQCRYVECLQSESPIVTRISAHGLSFPHQKTDLVKKVYSVSRYSKILSELQFHRKYSHPNIIPILDSYFNVYNDKFTIIMEYKKGAGFLPKRIEDIRLYMKQLLGVLVFFRKHLISHHNLKPNNIIFDPTEKVLSIIDLEGCKLRVGQSTHGNPLFASPEKKSWDKHVGPSSDMYSAGLIFRKMLAFSEGDSTIIRLGYELCKDDREGKI